MAKLPHYIGRFDDQDKIAAKSVDTLIPEYMVGGLRRYIEHGIRPGKFLEAVLSNNLYRAAVYGDETNVPLLGHYIKYLLNHASADCWGAPEKVEAWIAKGGLGWAHAAVRAAAGAK